MEEAAPQTETPQPRKFVLWPLFFCVMPVLIAFGLFWLINRPKANEAAENKTSSAADLGPRGTPLAPKTNGEAHDPKSENTPPANTGETQPIPDKPEDAPVSDREIEIHIKNLKFAVQHNNGKGRQLESDWLLRAKQSELVNTKLLEALEPEGDAFVRLAFFECLRTQAARESWAWRCHDKRSGKFTGQDEAFEQGELGELAAYLNEIGRGATREQERLTLVRAILHDGKPTWALEVLALNISEFTPAVYHDDIEQLLRNKAVEMLMRNAFVFEWEQGFKNQLALLAALSAPEFLQYLPEALRQCRAKATNDSVLRTSPEMLATARAALSSSADTKFKQELIAALGQSEFEAQQVREMLLAGVQARDANLGDYIAALGRSARTAAELKQVAEYANESNADVARGAINGLRQSPLKIADDELRTILSVGQNSGVKGDALAALLERNPQTRDSLVDEYLLEDKAVVLRVIAVSYLSAKRIDQLKELGESDPEMRVREAAINKLGSLKDNSLKTWFTRVSRSDPVPVLRQLAKKYAAELGDQNKSPERSDG